jgi:molecular chaperone GrpE (heat shock protein)
MEERDFRGEPDQTADHIDAQSPLPDGVSRSESGPVEFEKLNIALSSVGSAPLGAAPALSNSGLLLAELVEDMTDVLKRLLGIEESLARLSLRIDQVEGRIYETGRAVMAELASQRRELVGERKSVLARGLFNAVVGHLDALRAIRQGLAEGKDRNDKPNKRMIKQIEAVEITLVTALQGMGFREFQVREGDPFSPTTMECLGYVKGEPLVVLRVLRPGFEAPEGVVRPAGVYIAEPLNSLDYKHPSANHS